MFRYLPEQASEIAPKVDFINNLITDLSVFFTVAICGAAVYFAIKYRRRNNQDHETPRIEGSHALETVWTVMPTLICIVVAYYGVVYYNELRTVPANALSINVTGQKWSWSFKYENGKETAKELVVPANQPIKLVLQATDVLHSLFIPAMRVKRDAVPGQYNYVSFTPVKTGEYHIFCTEYCGDSHYDMTAKLKVVSQAEYDLWINEKEDAGLSPVEVGQKLYITKGCNACHSLDGSKVIGPSFLKLFGKEEELTDSTKIKVDENYLKESILNPNVKIAQGFVPNLMPAFEGQLSNDQIDNLIAFIKSIDGTNVQAVTPAATTTTSTEDLSKLTPVERGQKIYQERLCITCHSLDGSKLVGPSFKGIYNHKGVLESGEEYIADDAYIKNSILNPMSEVVKGYPAAMPPYQGQLTDDDINGVIEYMKTLK